MANQEFIRQIDLAKRWGLTRGRIAQLVTAGRIPKPTKRGWTMQQVLEMDAIRKTRQYLEAVTREPPSFMADQLARAGLDAINDKRWSHAHRAALAERLAFFPFDLCRLKKDAKSLRACELALKWTIQLGDNRKANDLIDAMRIDEAREIKDRLAGGQRPSSN